MLSSIVDAGRNRSDGASSKMCLKRSSSAARPLSVKSFFISFSRSPPAGRQQRGMFLFPVINASGFVRTDAETAVKLNGGEGGGLGRRFDYAGDFFGRFGRGSGRG